MAAAKLGALARQQQQRSGSADPRTRAAEVDAYFESTRSARVVRDTSAEAIKQRQASASSERRASVGRSASPRRPSGGDAAAAEGADADAQRRGLHGHRQQPASPHAAPARSASPRRAVGVHALPQSAAAAGLRMPSPGRGVPSSPRGGAVPARGTNVNRDPSPRRVQFADSGGGSASALASVTSTVTARPPLRRGSSRERLAELGELLKEALITQAEFDAKRKAILDAI